jgi:CAAX protease family protein
MVGIPINLSQWLMDNVYMPAYRLSDGLVRPNMIAGLAVLALTLVLVYWPARLTLSDVGLARNGIKRAFIAILSIWFILQVAALVAALIGGSGVSLNSIWTKGDLSGFGQFLSQLSGTAPAEELLFRGIILVQVLSMLLRWRPCERRRMIALAMLVSAIAFALPHVPNRILNESYSGLGSVLLDQTGLTVAGLIFAWIFLSTGNLWFSIGFHALINAPSPVFASPLDGDGTYQVILLFGVFVPFLVPGLRLRVARWLQPAQDEACAMSSD